MRSMLKALAGALPLLLATTAPAGAARAQTQIKITERRVTTSLAWETLPRLGNDGLSDIVVYTGRYLLPDGTFSPGDTWYQRLVLGAPFGLPVQVTVGPEDDLAADVSGDHIVYTAYQNRTSLAGCIVLYQISSDLKWVLGCSSSIGEARIHGTTVAWRDGLPSSYVNLYDISWLGTGATPIQISGPESRALWVDVGDRFVVWSQYASGSSDISAYDLTAGVCLAATSTPSTDENEPSTSGPWIMWRAQDEGAVATRIEAKNMETGEFLVVAYSESVSYRPRVRGDLATYESRLTGNIDVFLYLLSTNETFQITTDPSDQYLNDVFGNLVAWVDMRSGNEDVYVATLDFTPTTPVDPSCTLVPGIVGCYTFDGDALDHGGNMNHGVLDGGLGVFTAGKRAGSGALVLDGVDDYVSVGTESPFDLGELTISAIVRIADPLRDEWIVSKGPGFGNFTLRVLGAGHAHFPGYGSYVHQTAGGNWSSLASAGPVPANEWVHLLVTLSPAEFRAYLNGALHAVAVPAAPNQNDAPVTIGAGGYDALSEFFAGAIDELRIYGRALGAGEVCGLHNATFNTAPVAEAGPDQAPTLVGTTVTLDGTQSWDPDGDALAYQWTFLSRPPGSGAVLVSPASARPTFVADVNGTYVVQLSAADPCLAGQPDMVTISFQNVRPVAIAGPSRTAVVGDTVTLDGTGSHDANGDPLAYQWTLSAPPGSAAWVADSAAAMATFAPDVPGTYVATLVVSDGIAWSDPSTAQIEVVTAQTAAVEAARGVQEAVASLGEGAFRNGNMMNALLNKLNAVIRDIAAGSYASALDKLENDVLGKTDGCAAAGAPDRNDWVKSCADQERLYPLVLDLIAMLRVMG